AGAARRPRRRRCRPCSREDAVRVMEVLPKRLARFGLRVHPDKTRLVDFRRPLRRALRGVPRGHGKPGTFVLLGFTHYWGRSSKGRRVPVVKRKTSSKSFSRSLKRVAAYCRRYLRLSTTYQARKPDSCSPASRGSPGDERARDHGRAPPARKAPPRLARAPRRELRDRRRLRRSAADFADLAAQLRHSRATERRHAGCSRA